MAKLTSQRAEFDAALRDYEAALEADMEAELAQDAEVERTSPPIEPWRYMECWRRWFEPEK